MYTGRLYLQKLIAVNLFEKIIRLFPCRSRLHEVLIRQCSIVPLTGVDIYINESDTKIRILYRISALVWRSVTGCAPSYLTDLCRLVSDLASRRALRSSARGELLVPRARSALKQRR